MLLEVSNQFFQTVPMRYPIEIMEQITQVDFFEDKLNQLVDIQNQIWFQNKRNEKMLQTIDTLNYSIQEVTDIQSNEFKMISTYIENTKENCVKKLEGIFRVSRCPDAKNFNQANLKNRMLLFHGSRVANFKGILEEGLLVAPEHVPHTAFLFGKGIYFTDSFNKAQSYCKASTSQNNCLMLVCEVALGTANHLKNTDSEAHNLPPGTNSVVCLAKNQPDPSNDTEFEAGVRIPLGKMKSFSERARLYDEFVVYDRK